MKEVFITLNNQIRNFAHKVMICCAVFILIHILTIGLIIYVYLELSDDNYHLYMNTTTSLEEIHNVKIDPFDGKLTRDLTTEEVIVRKTNRRWHLRYLFK